MTISPIGSEEFVTSSIAHAPPPVAENTETAFSSIFCRSLSSGSVDLDAIFEAAGEKYDLPPNLLKAVAKAESNFKPYVTSKAGAMGIMQLMPGTARGLGVSDPFDPEQNIMGGAKYLRGQLDRFDGNLEFALAAYNAGPGAVTKYGGIPPYKETQNYVPKVIELFNGGDITAGEAELRSFGINEAPDTSRSSGSSSKLLEAFTQMMMLKIIEMQMSLSNQDDKKIF